MDINSLVTNLRRHFCSGATIPVAARLDALHRLSRAVETHRDELVAALKADLNKPAVESYMTEICVLQAEISHLRKHLRRWARPRRRPAELMLFPAKCFRIAEPYGVVLVMAPWNYPLQLCLLPVAGALAAGNCVLLKPSAFAPQTSAAVARLIAEAFPPELCTVVEGGRQENGALLEQTFDYIFFTGGTTVGRLVMEKAAAHLTPVSLELGGKSPVVVDASANMDLTAKRLVFGKFINAGQTCVAPDYVWVPEALRDKLVERLVYWITKFYPKGTDGYVEEMPKIVNEKHFDRLYGLMAGSKVAYGGHCDRSRLYMEPTLLVDVTYDQPVMQEEIFGPLLPLLTYTSMDSVLESICGHPKPLALYLFCQDKALERRVLEEVPFGGGCVNDTLLHVSTPHLPFGGVGHSGMGAYHGKASFDTFTHYKSIVRKATFFDPAMRYRPYTKGKRRVLRWLLGIPSR